MISTYSVAEVFEDSINFVGCLEVQLFLFGCLHGIQEPCICIVEIRQPICG